MEHTTRAAVGRRDDGRVAFASLQGDGAVVELGWTSWRPGRPDGWAGYPAGVVAGPARPAGRRREHPGRHRRAGGCRAVLVGRADLLGRSRPQRPRRARAARRRTSWSSPAAPRTTSSARPTGILDQSASVLCTAGHALFLDTRDRTSEQVPLDLAAAGLALLVVDSGVTHDHAEGGYGDRRRECEEAAERLGVGLLREIEDVAALDVLADGTPRATFCCAGRGTSSPRTPACSRWSPRCGGTPTRGPIGPMLTAGPRVAARRLRDLGPAARRDAWTRRSRPARTVPAWWAAVSGAAPSRWSTATRSTRVVDAITARFERGVRAHPARSSRFRRTAPAACVATTRGEAAAWATP